ncbi:thioredoxin domain-containing protein [Candidatus Woesearchaeota archaeon]|nr:thioredoxin domain-containing protein [Candidatus Woesearchaeota archaeon]
MEQKQLDEMEESFSGEEFIDDYDDEEIVIEDALHPKEAAGKAKKAKPKKGKESKASAIHTGKKNEPEEKRAEEIKKESRMYDAEEKPVESKKMPFETAPRIDPWADEKEQESAESDDSNGLKNSGWKIITGIAIILLILSIFTQGFNFSKNSGSSATALSLQEGEQKVLTFVNENLLQPPYQAQLQSSVEVNGLYKVTLAVAGQVVDSYITKDGALFFPQGFDTSQNAPGSEQELAPIDVSVDNDPVLGDSRAPVTIIEFSDYQCPFCGKFVQETLPQLKQEYITAGKVKLVYRDFPLEIHPEAQPAALAAECAKEQNKYWEYHDQLFENQDSLSASNYKKWAQELGLNSPQFNNCIDTKKYQQEVRKDQADGASYGVTGTPAFFINGRMISGAQPFEAFKAQIDRALATAAAPATGEATQAPEQAVPVETAPATEPAPAETTPTAPTTETAPATPPPAELAPLPTTFTINAKKWLFSPNKITVKKNERITFIIEPKDLDFTFAIPNLGISKVVSGKTTIEFTPTRIGSFQFACSSCDDWRGMTGTLVVQ